MALGFREVAKLGAGKSFGELALISNKPRMATIRTQGFTTFATLDKNSYTSVLAKIEKKAQHKIIEYLLNFPFFKGWTKSALIKFSYYLKKVKYSRNQTVFQEGKQADAVFLIKNGEFEMKKQLGKILN